MKAPLALIGIGHFAIALGLSFAIPPHIMDSGWPAHAQTHVFQALLWFFGLNLLCLLILLIPFRKHEKWAWWALLIAGMFIYGGYWIPEPFTQGGAPGIVDDSLFALAWVMQVLGLVMARSQFK